MRFFHRIFRANRSSEEVVELLNAILKRTISDENWDVFISVKIIDPELEKVRARVEELWVHDSPYRVARSIDPTDLNQKGVAEIKRLIDSLQKIQ